MNNNISHDTNTNNQTKEKEKYVIGSVMEITGAEAIPELGATPKVEIPIVSDSCAAYCMDTD